MSLIQLKGVSKIYRNNKVLQDVNLKIEEGDLLGVIGQSGSGKTTLLNLIAGFIHPTDGEIVYFSKVFQEERDLHQNFSKIKGQIGFTPQHNSFYPKLTVWENLIHFGKLYKVDRDTLFSNIDNLLQFTQLADHKHKLAEHLSGGMQKRLDISCSLIHKPRILILDEPTADLDPMLQKEILNLLQAVNKQGITVVVASHHLDSIENTCNKVAIVHKGRVYSHGLLNEVRKPFQRDHFTINVEPGENRDRLIAKLKTLSINKIIDQGHSLVIYPKNLEPTMASLFNIIKEDGLLLHDLHFRGVSLNEIFEKIVLENR